VWQTLNNQSACSLAIRAHQRPVPQDCAAFLGPIQSIVAGYNTQAEAHVTFLRFSTPNKTDVDLPARKCTPSKEEAESSPATLVSSVSLLTISRTFYSLFKVLFIFPSRYLFAIGLSPLFSFRWYLPPILVCIPKQTDSRKMYHIGIWIRTKDGILTLYDASFQRTYARQTPEITFSKLQFAQVFPVRFQNWALPASFAITRGILVSFFSSAYWYA